LRPDEKSGRIRNVEETRFVNDVIARLGTIAQSQGKRLAEMLGNVVRAVTEASKSDPQLLDPKGQKLARTHLSPLHWLLIAASFSGAAAALAIVLGFELLNNTGAAIAPLKERVTSLGKRLDAIEHQVTEEERARTEYSALTNSTLAEIQKMLKVIAAPSNTIPSPSGTATLSPDFGRLEKRVAALEKKEIAAGDAPAEVSPVLKATEGTRGETETSFPPFDPVNFSPLIIWLTLSFGLLYLLMSKIAVPRVEKILHARAHTISDNISKANVLRAQAEEASAAHDKTIADAKAKALALAQETHAKLNAETEAKRHALEVELNAKIAASEAQVLAMKAKAMGNVGAIAGETAEAIVQHITGKPADQSAIAAAIATQKA
jgi:F-type H+-transporting ATPase subunit b